MKGRVALACALLWLLPSVARAQTETVEYYALDAVGSVRVVFDATGNIIGRMDYAPFGQEMFGGTNLPDRRFAGLFRDGEAGLDSAGARSYQSRTGRFSAVDPIYAGLFEPQRWNRYAYSLNSPIDRADPNGLLTPFRTTSNPGCDTHPAFCEMWALAAAQEQSTDYGWGFVRVGGSWEPDFRGGRGIGGTTGTGGTGTGSNEGEQAPPGNTGNPPPGNPKPGPEPPRTDCSRQGWRRVLPDYVNVQFSLGFGYGGTVHVALDRYLNAYFGIGPSAGKGLPVSGSATVGYGLTGRTQQQTIAVLSGHGMNATVVPWAVGPAGGVSISPRLPLSTIPVAAEVGIGTVQAGAGYSYTWMGSGGSTCR